MKLIFVFHLQDRDVMIAVFGVLMFIGALVIHEAGHAIAMMRRGIEIEEAGIGLPITGKVRLTFRLRWLPFPLVITPALLGAYVAPSERGQERLDEMGYKDRAVCYGAGVIMNLAFGVALPFVFGLGLLLISIRHPQGMLPFVGVTGGILAVIILLRRVLSWMVPVLGVMALGLIVFLIALEPSASVGGPGTAVAMSASATSWLDALAMGALISISLGIFNMIPLFPMDGGRIMADVLRRTKFVRVARAFESWGVTIFVAFIVFSLAGDVFNLVQLLR